MNHSRSISSDDPIATFTTDTCNPQDLMIKSDERPLTPPSQPNEFPPRFILGQEVFILDSSGTEPTGLTTYLVLSNHEKDATGRILYRLMPSQEVVFRAAETRLLEVKFPLGAEVKRVKDTLSSVVTKRYVVGGERVYDLRDELGRGVKGVKEECLSPTNQGNFPFVTEMDGERDLAARDRKSS